jgi:hypothetical protein
MVNDDKTFLRITPSGVLAFGSPWSGKHGLATNICLPLRGICFLSRGKENVIQPELPEEAMPEMLHQCLIPEDAVGANLTHELLKQLAQAVPLWKLECTKDQEAAHVSYRAMSEV